MCVVGNDTYDYKDISLIPYIPCIVMYSHSRSQMKYSRKGNDLRIFCVSRFSHIFRWHSSLSKHLTQTFKMLWTFLHNLTMVMMMLVIVIQMTMLVITLIYCVHLSCLDKGLDLKQSEGWAGAEDSGETQQGGLVTPHMYDRVSSVVENFTNFW